MNILLLPLCRHALLPVGRMPRSRLAGSRGRCTFHFIRNQQITSWRGCTIFCPHHQCGVPLGGNHPLLVLSVLWLSAILCGACQGRTGEGAVGSPSPPARDAQPALPQDPCRAWTWNAPLGLPGGCLWGACGTVGQLSSRCIGVVMGLKDRSLWQQEKELEEVFVDARRPEVSYCSNRWEMRAATSGYQW